MREVANNTLYSSADQAAGSNFRYIETLAKNQASLEDFHDGGPASEKFDRLSNTMTERALTAMTFLDLPQ